MIPNWFWWGLIGFIILLISVKPGSLIGKQHIFNNGKQVQGPSEQEK
jgi:hypothetical protein